MKNEVKFSQKISGRYKFQVLQNGVIVEERPWSENMILNTFLDGVCSSPYPNIFGFIRYHAIGTGSAAVAATDTNLQNESKRTGTRVTGSGNLGSSWSGNVLTVRQTFDHTEEVSNVNYTEHGLSDSATANAKVRTRALISGGTLTVLAGQQARCIYDISITVTPNTATAASVGGTGWPVSPATTTDGDYIIAALTGLLGGMDSYGGIANGDFLLGRNGSTSVLVGSSISLPSFGSAGGPYGDIANSSILYDLNSYTPGTFTFTISPRSYATPSSWSSTSIQGWLVRNATETVMVFKYDQNQTKANTHKLRYPSITVTWSR